MGVGAFLHLIFAELTKALTRSTRILGVVIRFINSKLCAAVKAAPHLRSLHHTVLLVTRWISFRWSESGRGSWSSSECGFDLIFQSLDFFSHDPAQCHLVPLG